MIPCRYVDKSISTLHLYYSLVTFGGIRYLEHVLCIDCSFCFIDDEIMNGQASQHSRSTKSIHSRAEMVSHLPEKFISSLRQLFSILDKTNCGYVSFDLFKRYFDCSTSTLDFLNELEIESKANNYYITFDLLVNVIQRTISTTKYPPNIRMPKSTHSLTSISSMDATIVQPKPKYIERDVPLVCQDQRRCFIRHNSTDLSIVRLKLNRYITFKLLF